MNESQYALVCARRLHQDNLVWQTPPLAVAALAFLLAAAFNPEADPWAALLLSILAVAVAIASIQLIGKHRHLEIEDAEALLTFERENLAAGYEIIHGPRARASPIRRSWYIGLSSFWIWVWILTGFGAVSGYGVWAAGVRVAAIEHSNGLSVPGPAH